nr:Rh protein homolog-2 [Chlamydomonas reinhardtii]AAM19664.1 Rh2 protein [Chlamydomonas reinhardtii]|eukprot:XP_001695465.1 Rh protein [Chlamydomonas reinhardtii]
MSSVLKIPTAMASGAASRRHSLDWSHVGLPPREPQLRTGFAPSVIAIAAVIVGLFFGLTQYTELAENAQEQVERYYKYFIDVQVMIFIGFGFLMTFMRRYSYGAVSLNYFASALMFLEAILMIGATQQVFWNYHRTKIQIDMALLIDCAFCAGSGMIAFGAIIGKATPTQVLWLLFWQVPLYALNQQLVIHTFKALDMGGTIVIHLFGAYYGLAASLMISRKQPLHGLDNPKNSGAYLNDIFSMIGTIFLFIYWPSFNGALASVAYANQTSATYAEKSAQFLAIVNTLLSLLGAVLSVFATSALVGGRFNMVHIQNSTLAGGVAMGAACTLRLTPGGALAVGLGAGAISTLGFQYLMPFLDRTIGLGDTCGVHNLHGIPAIVGTLVAGLAALGQHSDYLEHDTGRQQLGYQVLAGVVTMGIAIAGGLLGGFVVSWFNPCRDETMALPELFDDGPWWVGQRVEPMPISTSIHLSTLNSRHQKDGGSTQRGNAANASVSMANTLVPNPAEPRRHGSACPAAPIAVSGVPAAVAHHSLTVSGQQGAAHGAAAASEIVASVPFLAFQQQQQQMAAAAAAAHQYPQPFMSTAVLMGGAAGGGGANNDRPLFSDDVIGMETALAPVQPMQQPAYSQASAGPNNV